MTNLIDFSTYASHTIFLLIYLGNFFYRLMSILGKQLILFWNSIGWNNLLLLSLYFVYLFKFTSSKRDRKDYQVLDSSKDGELWSHAYIHVYCYFEQQFYLRANTNTHTDLNCHFVKWISFHGCHLQQTLICALTNFFDIEHNISYLQHTHNKLCAF